jgi:hypothetical protein
MIIHKKPYILASRLITLGMVRRMVCELKGKKMNWATYGKWTSMEQFCCMKAKGVVGVGVNDAFQ